MVRAEEAETTVLMDSLRCGEEAVEEEEDRQEVHLMDLAGEAPSMARVAVVVVGIWMEGIGNTDMTAGMQALFLHTAGELEAIVEKVRREETGTPTIRLCLGETVEGEERELTPVREVLAEMGETMEAVEGEAGQGLQVALAEAAQMEWR